jgi:hypothetical protein
MNRSQLNIYIVVRTYVQYSSSLYRSITVVVVYSRHVLLQEHDQSSLYS